MITDVSDILYRNIYTHGSNQMMMIKSNGGSGTAKNLAFENFIGHSNAYSLDFNAYWSSMVSTLPPKANSHLLNWSVKISKILSRNTTNTPQSVVAGDGVEYSDISFSDWTGTAANGVSRAPINIICPSSVPCTGVSVTDFNMWTDAGSSILYEVSFCKGPEHKYLTY